ncbi:MAG: hypothetical protein EOQ86_02140 [Mesorhizobium sp.]|uniref:hypothetical protein n=1 Tax=Mesorhizobium sp. TaxID=1871066 RepID=UPI000FE5BCD8|nr:hypothetical protein [Mesorhizobium sp.]RWH84555.1 MAG: hypothetical protein EOQ85_03130 [Mesorhizobium sp.]RWH86944.1 MAG: hypothetical protein EOQ86_02140 [Mesorhizobium sp.]RWH93518.1 MAG: hypothetical protein EOQ87_02990 [Mesorhizobium sp.]RWI03025.1 MAG: hypothetical protein EOQ88_02140 [Mesorhizobium sp.]RWI05533.1 MAG: hypothetical protein EOQ89_06175 [Mesorhizobium sp.]
MLFPPFLPGNIPGVRSTIRLLRPQLAAGHDWRLRLQQSFLREPICGVTLIGVDPIALEPALLGVLLLASVGQNRVSSTLPLAKSVIAPTPEPLS